jgi:oligoribonuclease
MRIILDIETTGLRPLRDRILEISAIAISDDLVELGRFTQVIGWSPQQLSGLADDKVHDMHTQNGLWADVDAEFNNPAGKGVRQVDFDLAQWMRDVGASEEDQVILVGRNASFDHDFLSQQLRLTPRLLHYRKDDVGSIQRFVKDICKAPGAPAKTTTNHRSMVDCEQALADLQALRAIVVRP